MNLLEELKLHVDSLSTAVESDAKFFASVIQYVRRLRERLSDSSPSLTVDELGVLSRKLEEFWSRFRPRPTSGSLYIPPVQASNTEGIIGDINRLVGELKRLNPEEFAALLPIQLADLSKSRFWVREQSQFEDPFFGPSAAAGGDPIRRVSSGPSR